jgi:hypothetical protein
MSNEISLTFNSPYVPNGAYAVQSAYTNTDQASDVATLLAAAINADSTLQSL